MGTPLNSSGENRYPSIKLRNVGDHVDTQVVDVEQVPRTVFGTGEQRIGLNGKPQTQDRVTVLVIGGSGVIHVDDADRPVKPDEIAVIYIAGRDRWDPDGDKTRSDGQGRSWSAAQKQVGGLQVGDVMRWRFDAEIPGQGSEPRKVRLFQLRRPRADGDEAERAQRCEQIHTENRQSPAIGVGAGASGYDDSEDETPF